MENRTNTTSRAVVIIEDDSVFRRGLVKLFENENCSVSAFPNANGAYAFVKENLTDFVVCDYKLPGMNGLEFLTKLREKNNDTPFVLVTAHFSEELFSEAIELGAADAMTKPLDIGRLRTIFHDQTDGVDINEVKE